MLTGEAKIGGGFSKIVDIGAGGSATWRGQTIESDDWNRARDYAESHQVTDLWSRVMDASRRYSTSTGESEAASLDESLSANLTRMRSFSERASMARTEAESWSEQSARVEAEVQTIDRDLGQAFFVWLSGRPGADGRPIGSAGALRMGQVQTPEDAEVLREYAAAFVAERFPAPAGPDPAGVGGQAEYDAAREVYAGTQVREVAEAREGWRRDVRGPRRRGRRARTGRRPERRDPRARGDQGGHDGERGRPRGAHRDRARAYARGTGGRGRRGRPAAGAPRHRERAADRRLARQQAVRHRRKYRARRGRGSARREPVVTRARVAEPVAMRASDAAVMVVEPVVVAQALAVLLYPHMGERARPGVPVETLSTDVGETRVPAPAAAEGGPVPMKETAPERAT